MFDTQKKSTTMFTIAFAVYAVAGLLLFPAVTAMLKHYAGQTFNPLATGLWQLLSSLLSGLLILPPVILSARYGIDKSGYLAVGVACAYALLCFGRYFQPIAALLTPIFRYLPTHEYCLFFLSYGVGIAVFSLMGKRGSRDGQ